MNRKIESLLKCAIWIFHHSPVRQNPLSLHLLDVIAKLEFHAKQDIESYKLWGIQDWSSVHNFTKIYSTDVKEQHNEE